MSKGSNIDFAVGLRSPDPNGTTADFNEVKKTSIFYDAFQKDQGWEQYFAAKDLKKRQEDEYVLKTNNRAAAIAEQYAKKQSLTGGMSTLGYKSILGE